MQVILNVAVHEINHEFTELIKLLVSKNVEIVIRKEAITLEEFDSNVSAEQVIREFSQLDYSPKFLADLEQGLKSSSIYNK